MRGNDDQEPFLPSVEEVLLPRHSTLATTAYFAWNLIATASILLSIILTANILSSPKTPTQRTEEISSSEAIENNYLANRDLPLKQLRFSGSLKYHDDGSLYLDRPSKGPEYVGNTTAVSHAWEMFESARQHKLLSLTHRKLTEKGCTVMKTEISLPYLTHFISYIAW
ncbi:hypothetical protein LTR78_003305 [Recurvomyces mirabilis]|uniref:Uncharacterized protein n=1 Tax=Recurvomyces mirabilis TaxID=574656 RepID=A0AAE0WS79_9PEZI|nr:hypothetical protein LTR78_003305 [Recurvomyces mirabilis]